MDTRTNGNQSNYKQAESRVMLLVHGDVLPKGWGTWVLTVFASLPKPDNLIYLFSLTLFDRLTFGDSLQHQNDGPND
jgi:hypothetical protein